MRLSASGAHFAHFATMTGPNSQPYPSLTPSLLTNPPHHCPDRESQTPMHTHLHPKEETPDSRLQLEDAKIWWQDYTAFCACFLQQVNITHFFLPRTQDFFLSHDFSFSMPIFTTALDVWTSLKVSWLGILEAQANIESGMLWTFSIQNRQDQQKGFLK